MPAKTKSGLFTRQLYYTYFILLQKSFVFPINSVVVYKVNSTVVTMRPTTVIWLIALIFIYFKTIKSFNERFYPTTSCELRHKSTHKAHIIKRNKAPITYYNNSVATFNLILECGDIEVNPGPRKQAPKCQQCEKTVRVNQKRFVCDTCHNFTHAVCANLTNQNIISRVPKEWTCRNCIHTKLPFFNLRNLELLDNDIKLQENCNEIETETNNVHVEALDTARNHTSIAHLNTQSINSTFDEFNVMLNIHKFDVISLSETWLKGNPHQLEYIQIPGYNFENNDRDLPNVDRGGGVGFYIRENIKYKVRKDLEKIDNSIEHQWIEICGKNKNSSYLIGAVYQPSSDDRDKQVWIEKFDNLISKIITKWDGIIFITGDTNINLLEPTDPTVKKYTEVLQSFDLTQLVDKPTRLGKKLIDHIITNIPNKLISTDVLPTDEISDHDLPYAIMNIRKVKFEPRYKYLRNEKTSISRSI